MSKLVEIARSTIRKQGGSLYIKIPEIIRRENDADNADCVVFSRESNKSDIIIQVEKK